MFDNLKAFIRQGKQANEFKNRRQDQNLASAANGGSVSCNMNDFDARLEAPMQMKMNPQFAGLDALNDIPSSPSTYAANGVDSMSPSVPDSFSSSHAPNQFRTDIDPNYSTRQDTLQSHPEYDNRVQNTMQANGVLDQSHLYHIDQLQLNESQLEELQTQQHYDRIQQQMAERELDFQRLQNEDRREQEQHQKQQQYQHQQNRYDDVATRIVEQERLQKANPVKYPKLEAYTVLEQLGEGAFSVVYKALHLASGQHVAIKILRKFQMDKAQQTAVLKEVTIMRQLNHPNIVKFIEFIDSDPYYYIVQELAVGGEIFSAIVKYTYLSEDLTRHVVTQLAHAIRYLHEEVGVVHRDIKPENLLFMPIDFVPSPNPAAKLRASDDPATKQDEGQFFPGIGGGGIGIVKLADFGLSKQIWEQNTKTPCGTVGYTAPEIVRDERYSKGVDMWAIGCVLYTLLCGFPPFYDEHIESLTQKVARGEYTFLSPWWDEISMGAKNCVSRLLTVDPTKRYTVLDLLNDPWLNAVQPNVPVAPSVAAPFEQAQLYGPTHPLTDLSSDHAFSDRRYSNKYMKNGLYSPAVSALRDVFDISTAVHRMGEEAALQNSSRAPVLSEMAEEEEEEEEQNMGNKLTIDTTSETQFPGRSAPRFQQQPTIPQSPNGFDLNMGAATILGRRKHKQPIAA